MTTLLIGAHEGRKFISFDVPGAFLQAEMTDDTSVLLKLKGELVDMMCQINPEFKPQVRYETTRKEKTDQSFIHAGYSSYIWLYRGCTSVVHYVHWHFESFRL